MKKVILTTMAVLGGAILPLAVFAGGNSGEAIFKANCSPCHHDGGNVMVPSKNIFGIKHPDKIIRIIRKGGDRMPAFDNRAISDADAKLLADYIIRTFK